MTGFRQIGNRHGEAHALDSLGYAYHFLGQAARRAWQAALRILSELHHPDASRIRAKLTDLGHQALPSTMP